MPTTVRDPNMHELPLAEGAPAAENGRRYQNGYGRVTVAPARG